MSDFWDFSYNERHTIAVFFSRKDPRTKSKRTRQTWKTSVEESDYVANLLCVPDVLEMSVSDYVNAQTDVPSQVDPPNAEAVVPPQMSEWNLVFEEAYDNP